MSPQEDSLPPHDHSSLPPAPESLTAASTPRPTRNYISKIPKGAFEAEQDIYAPLVKPEFSWCSAVTLVEVGIFAVWFGSLNVLLPIQADFIDSDHRELTLSLVVGIGAIAALFSNPFFGALSDHTTARYGRRTPWVLAGAVAAVFGLTCVAVSWTVCALIASWCLVQISLNAAFAAISATPNDRVDPKYRGEMAGWMASGQNLGSLFGIGLAVLCLGIVAGYVACITLLCVSVIPYVWHSRDRYIPVRKEPYRMKNFFTRFLISPRKYPDFAWAWLSRFLFLIPLNVVSIYSLYYLQDVVHYPAPKHGVLVLSGIFAGLTTITSLMAGLISDYKKQRKPLIVISGIMTALGCVFLALFQTWTGALVASIALGVGYGLFIPTHFAITTLVLPSSQETARDLGILNSAASLPQATAPLIVLPCITFADDRLGYSLIFLLSAIIFLTGTLLILKVKSVR